MTVPKEYFSSSSSAVVSIWWNKECKKGNEEICKDYLNNLLQQIKNYKDKIICINLDIRINENNSAFLIEYLKKLSKLCIICVNPKSRLFCIYHNIPIVLPPAYYRKKHIFDPLVKRFIEYQQGEKFLSKEHLWHAFNNEKKSLDDVFNFYKLLDILDMNSKLSYVDIMQKFKGYFLPCEEKILGRESSKNVKLMFNFYIPLFEKHTLQQRLRLFEIFIKKQNVDINHNGIIVRHLVKDIIEFGNEKLIFECFKFVVEKCPKSYSFILDLLESLYTPTLLKSAGINLIKELKLNFLNIGGKQTSHALRLRLYESLVDESEINELQQFKDLGLSIVNYLEHLPQPWSLKNTKILLSIIKKNDIVIGYILPADYRDHKGPLPYFFKIKDNSAWNCEHTLKHVADLI